MTSGQQDSGVRVLWGDPPPTSVAPKGRGDQIAALLKEKPGEWAQVEFGTKGAGISLRRRAELQVTSRVAGFAPDGKRVYDVWAKYVGEQQ